MIVEELWERFQAGPGVRKGQGAGALYRADVRRAYYAGAADVLRLVLSLMPGPESSDEDCEDLADDACDLLNELQAELSAHDREAERGRA